MATANNACSGQARHVLIPFISFGQRNRSARLPLKLALDGPERKVVDFSTRITRITVTGLALAETAV